MNHRDNFSNWFKVKRTNNKRMFSFIDMTRNPLAGSCYDCKYCYIHGINGMKKRFEHIRDKYSGNFRLIERILAERYKESNVFQCDCIDYLHKDNPIENIYRILEWIERSPNSMFLSLTKNPERYKEISNFIPHNMILGVTIPSNIDYPAISKAPINWIRFTHFNDLTTNELLSYLPRFISIEPIMKFDLNEFAYGIQVCKPDCVVIGYDNHRCKLDEPTLKETLALIRLLEDKGLTVIQKTIRKAWYEK